MKITKQKFKNSLNVGEKMAKKKKDELEELKEEEIEVLDNSMDENIDATNSEEASSNGLENELLDKLQKKEKECEEYLDMLKRTMADFDNFRKRTLKEKESLYDDGFSEAATQILPVLDNFERAVAYNNKENVSIIEGIEMILKMFKEVLQKMGVEEIPSMGEKFDPNYHNAIMHVEDENYDENIIVDVMLKGYKYKDKILRFSMVKVAN
ncbi:MAG: nucleotide exchange factor GrpE [Clostridiales bacterium]|jgi:molecular chaperone GrpE|nr:nucleotide exchange factor GrpE [Clostridiales bacterium]